MNSDTSPYDAAIADLEARISSLQATLDSLKDLRAQATGTASAPRATAARAGNGVDIPHDAFFQMTVVDAAEKYLALVKTTKRVPDLADALLKGGLKSTSKRFSEMTRIMLLRDPRFVRVNSEWGLAEWYPGLKKEKGERKSKHGKPSKPVSQSAPETGGDGNSRSQRIMAVMKTDPKKGWTATEVASRIQEKPKKVATTMWLLTKSGRLSKADVGYRIPDAA